MQFTRIVKFVSAFPKIQRSVEKKCVIASPSIRAMFVRVCTLNKLTLPIFCMLNVAKNAPYPPIYRREKLDKISCGRYLSCTPTRVIFIRDGPVLTLYDYIILHTKSNSNITPMAIQSLYMY